MNGYFCLRVGNDTPSTVEMPRKAEVERRSPGQQMAIYQGGNSTQGATHCQQDQWTEKLGYFRI